MENSNEKSKECDFCKGYPDGDYGQCGKCNRPIGSSPESTEMEEWERRLICLFLQDVPNLEIHNFVRNLLSSHSQKLVSELKEKIVKEIKIRVGGEAFTVNTVNAIDDIITTINNIK